MAQIILRARQSHLIEQFRRRHPRLTRDLVDRAAAACSEYADALLRPLLGNDDAALLASPWTAWLARLESEPALREAGRRRADAFELHVDTLRRAQLAVSRAEDLVATGGSNGAAEAAALIDGTEPALALVEDRERASTVTDPSIFAALARRFENAFMTDMSRLGVERPLVLTRVSEYVPEIVAFVERIIANGFAYEDAGDVYFDTQAFDGAPLAPPMHSPAPTTAPTSTPASNSANGIGAASHVYAKLRPESKGHAQLLSEGEGASYSPCPGLSQPRLAADLGARPGALRGTGRKRHAADFALWKSSRVGEPAWPSPWGQGRPGWHIECSAMASHVLGADIDVHAGGIDLAFPQSVDRLRSSSPR